MAFQKITLICKNEEEKNSLIDFSFNIAPEILASCFPLKKNENDEYGDLGIDNQTNKFCTQYFLQDILGNDTPYNIMMNMFESTNSNNQMWNYRPQLNKAEVFAACEYEFYISSNILNSMVDSETGELALARLKKLLAEKWSHVISGGIDNLIGELIPE